MNEEMLLPEFYAGRLEAGDDMKKDIEELARAYKENPTQEAMEDVLKAMEQMFR